RDRIGLELDAIDPCALERVDPPAQRLLVAAAPGHPSADLVGQDTQIRAEPRGGSGQPLDHRGRGVLAERRRSGEERQRREPEAPHPRVPQLALGSAVSTGSAASRAAGGAGAAAGAGGASGGRLAASSWNWFPQK